MLKKIIWSIKNYQVARMARHIIPALDLPGNLLDVGCSTGLLSRELQRKTSMEVVGIDVVCPSDAGFPVLIYDGEVIPFPENSFRNVLLCYVLHHSDDPVRLLKEAQRVCSHRLIVVEDIAETSAQHRIAMAKDRFYNMLMVPDMPMTYNFKSTKEWVEIFGELGLRLTDSYQTPSMPVNPVKQTLFVLDKASNY
jgi:ubiquinone/menaquinone biosynthesis C-methylase UbiE